MIQCIRNIKSDIVHKFEGWSCNNNLEHKYHRIFRQNRHSNLLYILAKFLFCLCIYFSAQNWALYKIDKNYGFIYITKRKISKLNPFAIALELVILLSDVPLVFWANNKWIKKWKIISFAIILSNEFCFWYVKTKITF